MPNSFAKFSFVCTLTVGLLALNSLGGCSVASDYRISDKTASSRNYSTVAGSVTVGEDSSIYSAKTVAGNITIRAGSTTHELKTVAGNIEIGQAVVVNGYVKTTAGNVVIQEGAKITGDVITTAGEISLKGTTVEGLIELKAGSVDLVESHIKGGIEVNHTRWGDDDGHEVRIDIGAGSRVSSVTVDPRTDAILRISKTAIVGEITGIEPTYY